MNARTKKACFASSVALGICMVPLTARVWLDRNGALERPELGVVDEFVMRDHLDNPLTRDHLRRSQTIILYWPESCLNQDSCSKAKIIAKEIRTWVEGSLRPKWTEENNPLVLLLTGPGASQFGDFEGWRRFTDQSSAKSLLPATITPNVPALIIVDNTLQFAAYHDLSQDVDLKRVERVLSKTAFDQYLGNYLSRRTFMGPKRTQN